MSEPVFRGWSESDLRRVLPQTSERVQAIVRYIAAHPECTSADLARDLGLKSERSVGPSLNNLTAAARRHGIQDVNGPSWPFRYGRRGSYWTYDMPAWARGVVLEVLGSS